MNFKSAATAVQLIYSLHLKVSKFGAFSLAESNHPTDHHAQYQRGARVEYRKSKS